MTTTLPTPTGWLQTPASSARRRARRAVPHQHDGLAYQIEAGPSLADLHLRPGSPTTCSRERRDTTFVLSTASSPAVEVAERLRDARTWSRRSAWSRRQRLVSGYYHFLDYVADLDEVIERAVPRARRSLDVGSVASYWAGTQSARLCTALLEGLADQSAVELTAAPQQPDRGVAQGTRQAEADGDRRRRRAAARYDPLLGVELATRLAAAGTRTVDDGFVWKHDPLHLTMGPYPFRRDFAAQYWQRITCPVLVVDGGATMLNLPEDERAARRAYLANHRHVTLPGAGHMMQRHQPEALAQLLLELA